MYAVNCRIEVFIICCIDLSVFIRNKTAAIEGIKIPVTRFPASHFRSRCAAVAAIVDL